MQQNMIQKATEKPTETKNKPQNLKEWVDAMKGQFAVALPKVITPERFTRMALTALSSNATLMSSTPTSFVGALMNAAQLGLEPNTPLGQAYLIPYKNNKTGKTECQFQIGYKGLIDLAYRSGDVTTIQAHVVYENDEFEYSYGLEPKLEHKPAKTERGKSIYVYAIFKLKNGGYGFEVMSIADVNKHAQQYSKAFKSGPWQTNFDEMAKKTVLKKVLKYAPIKTDFITSDNAVINANEIGDLSIDTPIEINPEDVTINEETGEVSANGQA